MKKTLTALAVSAATLAFGANAATTANYSAEGNDGNVSGTTLYSANGNKVIMNGRVEAIALEQQGKVNDKSRARIGLGGISSINDNLYGVGYWQGEFTTADNGVTDASSSATTRYAYAGLGGTFGQVTYGKQDGTLDNVTDMTDIMAYFGDSASTKLNVGDRPDNTVTYQGSVGNLTLKANYRFQDGVVTQSNGVNVNGTNGGTTTTGTAQNGYSGSALYAIGDTGAKLAAGYANQGDSHEYMAGAGYTIGNFYLGGLYTNGTFAYNNRTAANGDANLNQFSGAARSDANYYGFTTDQKYKGYEAAASYTFGKTVFTSTYNMAKTGGAKTTDNVAVDATYYFTSNFRTYIGYNFNLLSEGDVVNGSTNVITKAQAADSAVLGMRYDF